MLAILAPIITSYINIGFINEFNIERLFEKISYLIEYAIQSSREHNKKLALEDEITFSIISSFSIIDCKKMMHIITFS